MQLLIGVLALSVAMVTPLWAARAVLGGIMALVAAKRDERA
jgi:hypothetical protein